MSSSVEIRVQVATRMVGILGQADVQVEETSTWLGRSSGLLVAGVGEGSQHIGQGGERRLLVRLVQLDVAGCGEGERRSTAGLSVRWRVTTRAGGMVSVVGSHGMCPTAGASVTPRTDIDDSIAARSQGVRENSLNFSLA